MPLSRFPFVALVFLAAAFLPLTANGQKLARKAFEDTEYGYKFKHPDDFKPVPPRPSDKEAGIICKMDGKELTVRTDSGAVRVDAEGMLLRFAERTERGKEGRGGSVSETKVRDDVAEYLDRRYKGVNKDKPDTDEEKKIGGLKSRHRTWKGTTPSYGIPLLIDVWTFPLSDADVHLVYIVPVEHEKKWMKVFEKSAKTFAEIERKESAGAVGRGASYDELLAYHKADAEKLAGWTALDTPSKKFIIKTNCDNRKFIKEVIKRLEASRKLYEGDFPPSADFSAVSVVRVCANEEEFHTYGNTGGGTLGWFNPASVELVLFDAVNVDRNMSYAVMSHEAFHQYCHFLFEQSEAHRWFDEGHGDYYGAAKFSGSRAKITDKMPGGLNRKDIIKAMVRDGSYTPVDEHINFDHSQWRAANGSTGVDSYCQSWSLIYMLRQGSLKKVPKKVWKPEYADIIPNYVTTLHGGFRAAYDEILAEREAQAKKEGRELTDEESDVNRFDLKRGQKDEIWEKAIEASWGQIDLEEFEKDWLTFVGEHL
ncbi:MAG: hypothetical protein AAF682_20015 [Planctomycetota bacterium]